MEKQDTNVRRRRNNVISDNNKNNKNNKKKKNKVITILRIVSIITIIICLGVIIYRFFNLKASKKLIDNINSDIVITDKVIEAEGSSASLFDTDITSLKQKNKDTVAYIKVNGTNISYPVVQSSDNEFYLKHSFDKSYSAAGWIYMDYRNKNILNDNNTIIYGHNMLNNTMFSELTKMTDISFFNTENNNYLTLITDKKTTLWKIFSVYISNPDTYYLTTNFANKDNYLNFLNTIKTKSKNNFNVELSENDRILTLSTCTNLNTKRLVVHAKLVYEEDK